MTTSGTLTAEMARRLEQWLAPQRPGAAEEGRGFEVLYDHGDGGPGVGAIVSWFGAGDHPTQPTELTQLDIAVVKRGSGRPIAHALIEIEEGSDRPKGLLGDMLCILMADHVTFGREDLLVDERTSLIVLARGPVSHALRMGRVVDCVKAVQPKVPGRNKAIGSVFGELFSSEKELEEKLKRLVGEAVKSP